MSRYSSYFEVLIHSDGYSRYVAKKTLTDNNRCTCNYNNIYNRFDA